MTTLAFLLFAISEDWLNSQEVISITEYLSLTSSITVMGIAFLIATFFRKEKALYADIREESALYNCTMFVAVMTMITTTTFMVAQYLCSKNDSQTLANLTILLFVELTSIFYLVMERKLLKEGRFSPYYSMVIALVVSSIICSIAACCVYTPIGLVRKIQKDEKIAQTVRTLSREILNSSKTIPENIDTIIQKMSSVDQTNISEGDIKYTRINDKKFSLSWNVQSNPESLKNKKRLAKKYETKKNNTFRNYESGRCSCEYPLKTK
jgi:hypothetical protein